MKVYIKMRSGFGNKIFDLIISLYLIYKYNINICIIYIKSRHNKKSDPDLPLIFKKLNKYIKNGNIEFIDENHYKGDDKLYIIRDKTTLKEFVKDIYKNVVKEKRDIFIKNKSQLYKYIFNFYYVLPDNIKSIFKINKELLSEWVINIGKKHNYVILHIRYGDKIALSLYDNSNTFIMYTPYYYKLMIHLYSKCNLPIYIITDSKKIVKEFILNDIVNPDVKLLDIPYWSAFYLLMNSYYPILSYSSFSINATLFNKYIKRGVIIKRKDKCLIGEDYLVSKLKNVKIIVNKKYILNYDKKLMKKMSKL